jgi:glycerol-3-phosphate dehydrogenase
MSLRQTNLARLKSEAFDVLIVGGGINGAVAAAALAGQGVRVALIDRGDFAGFTSSQSSNLAWGGIKYLESYDFGLVRKLCLSRNRLIRAYPSTVQEIRFLTTLKRGFRYPRWFMWAGTWLYWLFGNAFTRPPRLLSRADIAAEEPAIDVADSVGGFEYSDAYLFDNDARFVFNFVRSALDRGAAAANYIESLGAERDAGGDWVCRARDVEGNGGEFEIRARVLINAAGPYVDEHNRMTGEHTDHRHLFSKGIHLVVDRITPNRRVLAFFASDGRLFFVIPMGMKTCIGTTDTRVERPETEVTDADRDFVLGNINARLQLEQPLTREDIIAERCGVRPLVVSGPGGGERDWMQLSRKHAVEVDAANRHLSIFGGKLTDCLNVGEEVTGHVAALGIEVPHRGHRWYGEPPEAVHREFLHQARLMELDARTAPESSEVLSSRLWRRYGSHALTLLELIREDPAQAEVLIEGTEYLRCELVQAAQREMVVRLEDFLRRRSKIALVERRDTIRAAPGLLEACRILFGGEAERRYAEYFGREGR